MAVVQLLPFPFGYAQGAELEQAHGFASSRTRQSAAGVCRSVFCPTVLWSNARWQASCGPLICPPHVSELGFSKISFPPLRTFRTRQTHPPVLLLLEKDDCVGITRRICRVYRADINLSSRHIFLQIRC